jgi:protein O-mannosyl-transferase
MKATGNAPRSVRKPGDDQPHFAPPDRLLAMALVLVTVFAYHPAWRAGFVWDDDFYVTHNPLLSAPDGLRRIWFSLDSPSQYFPLTYTTFYLERLFWGLNPAGYHCINILLHAANAVLVWRLLATLRLPGAWLAAALFALHPVQVESVAWISERKNVLMGFFFLLALLAWTKFIDETTKRPWRFYALALIFYALALSAKTTACTLPAALLLIAWLKKMPIGWRRLAQVAPFAVLGAAMGLLTVWWERFHQGTRGAVFSMGLVERLLVASRAFWFYAGKLLWPADLTFSYPRWTISASDPSAYGWLLATAALGVVIWRVRRRLGRGVEVAVLFFAATLSPVLGLIMLYTFRYSFVADHYQYLACLGPLALAAAAIEGGACCVLRVACRAPAAEAAGIKGWRNERRKEADGSLAAAAPGNAGDSGWLARRSLLLKPACCAVLLAILGVLTWLQCGQYADVETLWRATLARNPGSWMALDNLGNALCERGAAVEAITLYRRALAIHPDFPECLSDLGNALSDQGKVVEAIAQYREALAIQPNFAKACYNLGNALIRRGEVVEAIAQYRKALSIQPRFVEAQDNLGLAFFQNGQTKEAIDAWQQALAIKPDLVRVQNRLAWLLATASDATLRNGAKAVVLAGQANQATGGADPIILRTLAAAYSEAGSPDRALATARIALSQAQAQKDGKLADSLQQEIKLFEARIPTK